MAISAVAANGEVRLPKLLSSHMVIERDRPVHLWGWADVNETVTAMLNGATQSSTADRYGHWSLYLPPQAAGGPFEIKISGSNQIVLSDVLSGDVWFASGQSNMEMPLAGFPGAAIKNSAAEISQANQPAIRLLLVQKKASA
ncbi:MAG TPA: sialate O-acetylesterase, partial [Bryobacteraceae bacterium]|nr:sialate O-acetylesterase [Bryobacteraceae bacterium]